MSSANRKTFKLWQRSTAALVAAMVAATLPLCSTVERPSVHRTGSGAGRVAYFGDEVTGRDGIPVYRGLLRGRPSIARRRTYFAVLYNKRNQPVVSFRLLVLGQKKENQYLQFKATRTGIQVSNRVVAAGKKIPPEGGIFVMFVGAGMFVIGTLGGLAIDLSRDGYRASAQFVASLNQSHERVVTYTHFDYNERGRLIRKRIYVAAKKPFLLSETKF